MDSDAPEPRWSLEVVRGRKPGQVFPVLGPEIVLGTAPVPPSTGIDLAGQEGAKTRRMAGQQAMLFASGPRLAIRDLDSPSGTFVNRKRVLPGQDCPLRDGDEINLGAVVLRVADAAPPPANEIIPTPDGTFAYAVEGGPTCRSWDDFLVASAQRWEAMSDELASGRLQSFLVGIGRADLLPRSAVGSTADERLDAWLAGLPTTRDSRPELDVHPARFVIKASPGGGTIRRSARVANVGHRLLRSTARVEPPGLAWLRLDPEFADAPFATVEETELVFEVHVPEALPEPLAGEIIIEGNGGLGRIDVVLEPRPASAELPEPEPVDARLTPLAAWDAWMTPGVRIALVALAFVLVRLAAGIGAGPSSVDAASASGTPGLDLWTVARALGVASSLIGIMLAARRRDWRDVVPAWFFGGCVGALIAAVLVAANRAIEVPILGDRPWMLAVVPLWAAMGTAAAGLANFLAIGES